MTASASAQDWREAAAARIDAVWARSARRRAERAAQRPPRPVVLEITPEMAAAARDACRQVSDDLMQGIRDYRDTYSGYAESRDVMAADLDGVRHWRRMSWRFGRLVAPR